MEMWLSKGKHKKMPVIMAWVWGMPQTERVKIRDSEAIALELIRMHGKMVKQVDEELDWINYMAWLTENKYRKIDSASGKGSCQSIQGIQAQLLTWR